MAAMRPWLLVSFSVLIAVTVCKAEKIVFYETFDQDFSEGGRWVVSKSSDYEGTWKHAAGEDSEDFGLLVSEKARKYGIATSLPDSVDPKVDTVVLQYDLRFQNGIECGGSYLKFLMPQAAGWAPEEFNNESPYSIMFGPDKCGATNKVHFIFRHKDLSTGEYKEHHLKNPPSVITDRLSHVYSAVIYPNNTLKVLIDGEEKKTADLLSDDFDPPVLALEEIDDPEDSKPKEWNDDVKIADPEAAKPDEWDENAPIMIADADAVKPEGWLDDEPLEVDDPEATKPEDWDDAEDGDWEPSSITNPKCENAPGCGEWTRPEKPNPAYKGKWRAPMVDNPDYSGVWAAARIPNPAYVKLERPEMEPVAAIGIEIWTMDDGILFDNILVTHDEEAAARIRETSWKPKLAAEKAAEKVKEEKRAAEMKKNAPPKKGVKDQVFDKLYKLAHLSLLKPYALQITEAIQYVEGKSEIQYGILIALAVIFATILFSLLPRGRRKVTMALIPETAVETIPDEEDEGDAEEEVEVSKKAGTEVGDGGGVAGEAGGEEVESVSATDVSEIVADAATASSKSETKSESKSEMKVDGPAANTRRKSRRET